jgi:hypothetical protein
VVLLNWFNAQIDALSPSTVGAANLTIEAEIPSKPMRIAVEAELS